MKELQDEYEKVYGVTFFSTWDDFLFVKLSSTERQMNTLVEGIVELGKLAGIIDGTQAMTGPQILILLSDLRAFVREKCQQSNCAEVRT